MAGLCTVFLAGTADAETLCGDAADVAAGTTVVIGLSTGDTLIGSFVECDGDTVQIDHGILGRLSLKPDAIAEVVAGQPGEDLVVDIRVFADGEAPEPEALAPDAVEVSAEPEAEPEEKKSAWESQAELGLNGSEGNSERLSVRLGARTKRTTERQELTLSALYTRSDEASKEVNGTTEENGSRDTTEHKAIVKGLNDWLFPGSPWRYFVGGSAEYDEFQNYDVRLALSTGPGYAFIENDKTTLVGRAGLGTSMKIGGEEEDEFFELLFGYNFEHKFTDHQKIISTAAVFPNMSESGEYRVTATLAYDLSIVEPAALTLRLGLEDRYDSTIEDSFDAGTGITEKFDKNDLDYYAALIWDF